MFQALLSIPHVSMTELSAISFTTTPSNVSLLDDHSSVGTLMPYTFAKVVDNELNTLPPGAHGETLISGYHIFGGYYDNPEKTGEAMARDPQGRQWL